MGGSYTIQPSSRSLSLRKWAGHRTVKSPRVIQDLGLDAREPARGHQWTSLPDASRYHGITIQNGKAGKWILSSSGKKNGSKKVKGLKPSGNFIPPWSDFWWRQLQEHVPEVLFHSSQELLKRHGWKKPTPWPTVSIQMGNKLEPL